MKRKRVVLGPGTSLWAVCSHQSYSFCLLTFTFTNNSESKKKLFIYKEIFLSLLEHVIILCSRLITGIVP